MERFIFDVIEEPQRCSDSCSASRRRFVGLVSTDLELQRYFCGHQRISSSHASPLDRHDLPSPLQERSLSRRCDFFRLGSVERRLTNRYSSLSTFSDRACASLLDLASAEGIGISRDGQQEAFPFGAAIPVRHARVRAACPDPETCLRLFSAPGPWLMEGDLWGAAQQPSLQRNHFHNFDKGSLVTGLQYVDVSSHCTAAQRMIGSNFPSIHSPTELMDASIGPARCG